jgi:hypothetical protein
MSASIAANILSNKTPSLVALHHLIAHDPSLVDKHAAVQAISIAEDQSISNGPPHVWNRTILMSVNRDSAVSRTPDTEQTPASRCNILG